MLHLFCTILQINFVLSLKIHIMIQPEELRIGNWVQVKGTNNAITVSFPLHNELAKDWYSFLNAIEPIPLTPGILEKAGFVMSIDDENMPWFCLNGIYIDAHFDYHKTDGDWIKIQYLHQLQNLYFALTNTELNIEL